MVTKRQLASKVKKVLLKSTKDKQMKLVIRETNFMKFKKSKLERVLKGYNKRKGKKKHHRG